MDTLEGIARFWVLRKEIQARISDVESAISTLLEQGFLKELNLGENSGEHSRHYYQLNPNKLEVIKRLIEHTDSGR